MKYAIFIIIILCYLSNVYASDIYQYIDKNGRMVYTNKAIKGAKKVNLPPLNVYAAPMSKSDVQSNSYTNYNNTTSFSKKPRSFSSGEQARYKILQDELSRENQALIDAKQALTEGKLMHLGNESKNKEACITRTQALQDAVTEHQKNIEVLAKQLSKHN